MSKSITILDEQHKVNIECTQLSDNQVDTLLSKAVLEEAYEVFSLTTEVDGVELIYNFNAEEEDYWLEGFGNENITYQLTDEQERAIKRKLLSFSTNFYSENEEVESREESIWEVRFQANRDEQ